MNTPNEIRFYRAAGEYGFLSNLFYPEWNWMEGSSPPQNTPINMPSPMTQKSQNGWWAPEAAFVRHRGSWPPILRHESNWQKIKADRMRAVLSAKFTPARSGNEASLDWGGEVD